MPALAVADALRARGADVSFIGVRGTGASGVVREAGYREDAIPLRGFARKLTIRNLWTVWLAALATPRAASLLVRRHADVVVGGGGYVAGPVALAAKLTRRPLLLMEADSHLGMANRMAAPLAKRVTLAFPLAGRQGGRYLVTGRPVGREVVEATKTTGRRAFGILQSATVVLVVGGSQGARSLNEAAVGAFGDAPMEIIHVAGPKQLDETRRLLGDRAGERYRLFGWLDNLPEAVAAADLVVSRSGGSVFELAAIGRPSILVPYPHATADHQTKNAKWLSDAGAAVVVPDGNLTAETLRGLVGAILSDPRRLEVMADAARSVGRPEAADRVADEVLAIARGGRGRRRRRRIPRPRMPWRRRR